MNVTGLFSGASTIRTPAFVYSEGAILEASREIARVAEEAGCSLLYAVKPLVCAPLLGLLSAHVRGFAVSSLFEAELVKNSARYTAEIHIAGPAYRADELPAIFEICNFVSFNSLGQWERFCRTAPTNASLGFRINPGCSFVKDDRYNPCRRHSQLGVPLLHAGQLLAQASGRGGRLSGIHFHNNCDSSDFGQLLTTVRHIDTVIGPSLSQLQWINLGGGYLFDEADRLDEFVQAVGLLRDKHRLTVYIEPGAAIVRSGGFLVSTVLDLFDSDGMTIAILDTTVNHWPEVFEYQFEPDIEGHVENGPYNYILAGCSCLAGDRFGTYSFSEPLEIGSRIVFRNAGAYSIIKANTFNGINLPTLYALTRTGEITEIKRFAYEDFACRCGVDANAAV